MYYDIIITQAINRIEALRWMLLKVVQQAQGKGMSGAVLLNLSLAEDMFPLIKQIQIVTDNAKWAVARLTDKEVPIFEDNEETLADIYARIDTTVAFLKTVSPEDFNGADDKTIEMKYFPGKHFTGKGYFLTFYIPNFNFHATVAYTICRAHGFDIGKADYAGIYDLIDNK